MRPPPLVPPPLLLWWIHGGLLHSKDRETTHAINCTRVKDTLEQTRLRPRLVFLLPLRRVIYLPNYRLGDEAALFQVRYFKKASFTAVSLPRNV